jgi:hypothetical protein
MEASYDRSHEININISVGFYQRSPKLQGEKAESYNSSIEDSYAEESLEASLI